MTWEQIRTEYPQLPKSSAGWHQHPNGGGWTQVQLPEKLYFGENVVVFGGEFYGGKFYGGKFQDGVFYGGEFYAGKFYDGEFYGGEFHGGVFYGGKFIQITGLGSRNSILTIAPNVNREDYYVSTGCFGGSLDEFRAAIKKTHGDNEYATEYLAALVFAIPILNRRCRKPKQEDVK